MRYATPSGFAPSLAITLGTTALIAISFTACKTAEVSLVNADGFVASDLAYETLESQGQFDAMSKDSEGLVQGGRTLKFLADLSHPGAVPKVYFINLNYTAGGVTPDYAKYHYYFAQHHLNIGDSLEEFNASTYFTNNKRFLAGTIQTYRLGSEQTGDIDTFGIQLYPQDVIHGRGALDAARLIASHITIPGAKMAFVEAGTQQSTVDVAAEFAQAGIGRLTIEQILGSVTYIPMHKGEAWGVLRTEPINQDELTATDIPVFSDLPLDLTVVAGTITAAFQDTNSHINLKSKERNTPNAVLRGAGPDHPQLKEWVNRPIHMKVTPEGLVIEASTQEEIDARLKDRFKSMKWRPVEWKSTSTLLSYDRMCPVNPATCADQALKYGSKAANLGFLAQRQVIGRKNVPGTVSANAGYDLVPVGFGIPLQYYFDLVQDPANIGLRTLLTALIRDEKQSLLSPSQRVQRLGEVQRAFYAAHFPAKNLTKIANMVKTTLPGIEKIKIRSSANAEDIEGFDGAGLHDSYSAKPGEPDSPDMQCSKEVDAADDSGGEPEAKMSPRTISCAIKGVYASLWNKRAIDERSFSRINHSDVSMGISVLPAYDYQSKIAANAVVVSRVINSNDVYGYTMSVQKKNNLVTNPDPGTWSEMTIAGLGVAPEPTSLTITRFAKPKRDKPSLAAPILNQDQMLKLIDLVVAVERAWCKTHKGYNNGRCDLIEVNNEKLKSLDLEVKFLESNQFVVKQVREFAGH